MPLRWLTLARCRLDQPKFRAIKDLDSLFTGGKTTALTHSISGLDDFELVAFLVIQEAE